MKKNLHYVSIIILSCAFAISAQAQNAQRSRTPNTEFRAAAAKNLLVPSQQTIAPTAKYGNSGALPFALSGYYGEGFEGTFPPAGWQILDILDLGVTWVQKDTAYEGTSSAYCPWTGLVGIDGEDWLIMPQFSCIAGDSLSFWLEPEYVAFPPDTTFILISTTDSLSTSFTTVLDVLAEGLNYPTTVTFQRYAYDLTPFAGMDIWVAFANKNNYGDGILIDKVEIGAPPTINATAVSVDMPAFISTASNAPLASVMNSGIAAATFDVTMTITGGYTSTKTVTALGAGASQQVTFDPWSPVVGTQTISVQTLLAGDGYPTDDSIAITIKVLDEFTNYGWVSKAAMTTGLFGATPSSLNSNDTSYLYGAGGSDALGIVNNFNTYAPYSNTWSTLAPKTMGSFMAGSFTWNNKVYVVGGYNPFFTAIGNVQIYDIAAGTWSNGAPMTAPVGDFASGLYNDSLFYVIAGYDGAGDVNTVQIYNPATNSWSLGTNLPYFGDAMRGGIIGNKIVVSCGYNQILGATIPTTYVGTIDVANPSSITWLQVDDYPIGGVARIGGCASLDVASGLVVFTGGDPIGTGVLTLDQTFGFDVNTNTWKIGPDKITSVSNLANMTAIVDNDSLWIAAIGGYDVAAPSTAHEWLNLGPYQITVGMDEMESNFAFSLNPNPASDFIHASLSLINPAQVKISVTDMLGNEIAELCNKKANTGKYTYTWNTSGYSSGIYFCTLTIDGNSQTYKIIKY